MNGDPIRTPKIPPKTPSTGIERSHIRKKTEVDPKLPMPSTTKSTKQEIDFSNPGPKLPPKVSNKIPPTEKKQKLETDSTNSPKKPLKDNLSFVGTPRNSFPISTQVGTPKRRLTTGTPRNMSNSNLKVEASIDESSKVIQKSGSKKSFDFSNLPKASLSRKNSESKISLKKNPLEQVGSPTDKPNIPTLKKKHSLSNFDLSKQMIQIKEKPNTSMRDRSGSARKNTNPVKERSASRKMTLKERSASKKNLKINTKDNLKDPLGMTMTNAFGVTSTIQKVAVKKPSKRVAKGKKTEKVKATKPETLTQLNVDNPFNLETITIIQSEIKNIEVETLENCAITLADFNTKTLELNEKYKTIQRKPKSNATKKVSYEVKNLNIVKDGSEIGIVVRKELEKKTSNKRTFSPSKTVKPEAKKLDSKKLDMFETLKTKLNKLEINTDMNAGRDMECTMKSRFEQNSPKEEMFEFDDEDRVLFTDYSTNRHNKKTLVEGNRVENISKMLERHQAQISGESAATSSESTNRRKILQNRSNHFIN